MKIRTQWMMAVMVGASVLAPGLPQALAQEQSSALPGERAAHQGSLTSKDYGFLVQAARIDLTEVRAGRLAQEKGAGQAVREFSKHMINDHTEANTGLKEIAY